MNTRLLIIATVTAVALGAGAYVYLNMQKSSRPPDAKELLAALPTDRSTATVAAAKEWPQNTAIGRYDTMQRSGTRILGSWASGIREACMASAPITSIPDERSWQQPIVVHQCFDGVPVFRVQLAE